MVAWARCFGRRLLIPNARAPLFAEKDRLLFQRGNAIYGVQFDPVQLTVTGEPVVVLPQVRLIPGIGVANYGVSRNGVLAYLPARGTSASTERELVWLDSEGKSTVETTQKRNFHRATLSPNGNFIAVEVQDTNYDIFILDRNRSILERLVRNDGDERVPCWSPDGNWVYYTSFRDEEWGTYRRRYPIDQGEEQLYSGEHILYPDFATEDYLVCVKAGAGRNHDIWLIPLDNDSEPIPFLEDEFHDGAPRVSPDGNWIAYASAGALNPLSNEIYVQPFPTGGGRIRVSRDGGWSPAWSNDGRRLLYLERASMRIMAVPFNVENGNFIPEKPEPLLELPAEITVPWFEEGPDGRFLFVRDLQNEDVAPDERDPINIIFNFEWPAERLSEL